MVNGHADGTVSATKSENADALLAQVREVFLRAGANLMCGFRLSRMPVEQQGQHIKIEGAEHLQAALAKGKGAILLLAHMGPWESLSALGPLFARYGVGAQLGAMYRPLNNDYLEEWYREQRQRLGTRMYSRRDGFHNPVKHLRSGGILGILADQKMREGVEARFFGRMFKTNPIPGLFHRRSGAPIVRLSFFKTDSLSWILRCNPVEVQAESLDRASLARICNQGLERSLLESPNDCFWFTAL
jgi:KDO2-lipid IV(A) lauroyltransferase